jgi:DNA-binding NarL/FixJ family response regulator
LVDQFDRDGRRFLLARRNEPGAVPSRALSLRETQIAHLLALGCPNKLIAYELGLSLSSVAAGIAATMRKLGARTRVDLIRCLAQGASKEASCNAS